MSKIAATFDRLAQQKRKGLIAYIMAGYPYADITLELMHSLVAIGVDVIELGVPFSDPNADGPVIQKAGEWALSHNVTLPKVLAMVEQFRQVDQTTPVVLMGYANPIEHYDLIRSSPDAMKVDRPSGLLVDQPSAFVRDAAASGVDGVLIVDYPPQECEHFAHQLRAANLDLIFLLAPTSTDKRIQEVAKICSGYVYYVSLKGVTGSGSLDVSAVHAMMPRIRTHVKIPVGVGFGIRDAASAKAISQCAEAIVIGTSLIEAISNCPADQVCAAAVQFLGPIRDALNE